MSEESKTGNTPLLREYNLRPVEKGDRSLLEEWIAADPQHRGRTAAAFFLAPEPGVHLFVMEHMGEPVLFVRMAQALRLDIQFGPADTEAEKAQNAEAMRRGFAGIKQMAFERHIRHIVFESEYVPLVRFCERELGFTRRSDLGIDVGAREEKQVLPLLRSAQCQDDKQEPPPSAAVLTEAVG